MRKEEILVAGRTCWIYKTDSPEFLLIQPVDDHDMEVMDKEVAAIESQAKKPFVLVAFKVKDWQSELTPWAAPAVFGKIPFGDGAESTLPFIIDELMPALQKRHACGAETMKCLLGGYSLAGLFALWSYYQTQMFQGVAAVSPSVWFPDWVNYAENHTPKAPFVYLSLGDKEERAKNPVMAKVGDCIRKQHELLVTQGIRTILEWNNGNHFQNPDGRTAKGFAWLMNQAQ